MITILINAIWLQTVSLSPFPAAFPDYKNVYRCSGCENVFLAMLCIITVIFYSATHQIAKHRADIYEPNGWHTVNKRWQKALTKISGRGVNISHPIHLRPSRPTMNEMKVNNTAVTVTFLFHNRSLYSLPLSQM